MRAIGVVMVNDRRPLVNGISSLGQRRTEPSAPHRGAGRCREWNGVADVCGCGGAGLREVGSGNELVVERSSDVVGLVRSAGDGDGVG